MTSKKMSYLIDLSESTSFLFFIFTSILYSALVKYLFTTVE